MSAINPFASIIVGVCQRLCAVRMCFCVQFIQAYSADDQSSPAVLLSLVLSSVSSGILCLFESNGCCSAQACFPGGEKKPFRRNCMALMTSTGAKGSQVNFSQISCLLGQQVGRAASMLIRAGS